MAWYSPVKEISAEGIISVLRVVFSIFNYLLFIHAAYFGLFGIWGLFRKRQVFDDTEDQQHFAALIPARNEEAVR
jgi:hypothetical protein